jgi:CheY-like chemotaxis protein
MSITQNLLRLMNGEIKVESEPGKGSILTIYIPQVVVGDTLLGKESVDNLKKFQTTGNKAMNREKISHEPMPYGLSVDSADSGFAAIAKIEKDNVYDIIFMDQMMPGMDGVEATRLMREYGYKHPIVALTANAVTGQAEMFLQNGFDDFLAKPIDIHLLNEVLLRLIRDKQKQEVIDDARAEAAKHAQKDITKPTALDPQFCEIFIRDAQKTICVLEAIVDKGIHYNDDDNKTCLIHTHGMKSALANIGESELSNHAHELEKLGSDGKYNQVIDKLPVFITSLHAIVEKLIPQNKTTDNILENGDINFLHEKLLLIKDACNEYDEQTIEMILTELMESAWPIAEKDLLASISEKLLHSDFDEILDIIDNYL